MFYSPKHAQILKGSPARRRIAGVAVAGATAAVGSVAAAQSASASSVWDAVAQCESGGNWSTSTGNGFYGGLQFTHQTWQAFGGGAYGYNADDATREQQITIAQKVLQAQGPGAWPVCSQEAGLTSSNGGGSYDTSSSDSSDSYESDDSSESTDSTESSDSTESYESDDSTESTESESTESTESTDSNPTERSTDESSSRSTERTAPAPSSSDIAVDGIVGPNTAAAIEQWVGGSVDGDDWLSNSDIQKLQAKLGVSQDGVVGPETTTALQELVGANTDGIWGPQTTSALQQHLNEVL